MARSTPPPLRLRAILSCGCNRASNAASLAARALSLALAARGSAIPEYCHHRLSRDRCCCPSGLRRSWARTSSRRWIPARSNCMCAPSQVPASRRPPACWSRSSRRFATSFRRISSTTSSTISGCRIAVSTSPISNSAPIGPADGDILINLKGDHGPTDDYVKPLRSACRGCIREPTFSFLPADIVSQILNFGQPAPIDVQVDRQQRDANYAYAPSSREATPCTGHRGSAHAADLQLSADQCRRRPHPCRRGRA